MGAQQSGVGVGQDGAYPVARGLRQAAWPVELLNQPLHRLLGLGKVLHPPDAAECLFPAVPVIQASRVLTFLNALRQDRKKADTEEVKRGISAQTFNFYLQAVKQFCRWMVKDRRATESPVEHLGGLNVKVDRRHDRRALTVEEMRRLLEVASKGEERGGHGWHMTGPQRAALYRLAMETGLRSSELRSLTRSSFDLDADPPIVTVEAAYSKHRRQDAQPLRAETVEVMRPLLANLMPATRVFSMPSKWNVVPQMLRPDLEAAGIRYVDDAGRFADFHSLRHSFISNLAHSGVHPKVAQALARHSTITLTMDRYSHTLHEEHSAALQKLPDLSIPAGNEEVKRTGTDGEMVAANSASHSAFLDAGQFKSVQLGAVTPVRNGREAQIEKPRNSRHLPQITGFPSGGGGIRTHGGHEAHSGFQDRCNKPLCHPTEGLFSCRLGRCYSCKIKDF